MDTIVYLRATSIYDDSRATKEILALASKYYVTVLGWDRNGDSIENCKTVFQGYDNISLFFFPCKLKGSIGVKNLSLMLKWNKWLVKQLKAISKPSIIYSCNLDTGVAALYIKIRYKSKLIYDIYDYYVDSHTIPLIAKNIIQRLEITVINNSNLTVICTDERKAQICAAKPKKLLVIHNSPDIEELVSVEPTIDYVYCGTLNDGRLIKEILDGYPKHTDMSMLFAGSGNYSIFAEELNNRFDNFAFSGIIPYSEVITIEKKAAVISAIYDPDFRNHKLCAPNKFYEALALGKPLIVCRGTGIDKIVADNNIGIVIDYNANQFYKALKYLIDNEAVCKAMGERARNIYENQYRWSIMKAKLIQALDVLS